MYKQERVRRPCLCVPGRLGDMKTGRVSWAVTMFRIAISRASSKMAWQSLTCLTERSGRLGVDNNKGRRKLRRVEHLRMGAQIRFFGTLGPKGGRRAWGRRDARPTRRQRRLKQTRPVRHARNVDNWDASLDAQSRYLHAAGPLGRSIVVRD